MELSLSQSITFDMEVTLKTIPLSGGVTDSVFPKTESWLFSNADHQKMFRFIARRKDISKYRSLMDFIFCETFVQFKPLCFRFYEDKFPPLRKLFDSKFLSDMDEVLHVCLQRVHYQFCANSHKEIRQVTHNHPRFWGWKVVRKELTSMLAEGQTLQVLEIKRKELLRQHDNKP